MKPIRSLYLLLMVFLFFGLISILIPEKSQTQKENFPIRLPSLKSVFQPENMEYADIASVLQQKRSDTDSLVRIVTRDTVHQPDSLILKRVSQPLDYPLNDKTVLYPFFRELEASMVNNQGIHIFHYGDSQLEGDRITDYLRLRFQAEFGGSGPGMLPLGEEAYSLAMLSSGSGNWQKFNLMGTKSGKQGTHPYGPLGSFYRFSSDQDDSIAGRGKPLNASITFRAKGTSGGKTDHFRRCRIFYENYQQPVRVSFFDGDLKIKTDTLVPSASLQEYEVSFPETPSNLTIRFNGYGSPDFYGICLDSPSGIYVDNIPIRGSSGLEFTRMNPALVSGMFRILNVKLMILQFGVNVVPGDLDDYSYYENGLYSQISQLKKLNPGVSIIVIGVSDASRKNGDMYESYPCVEKIMQAQKNAALKSGCVFWNLYEAMGGKNSMPSWVFAKQPLASPDFLHFNYAGARIVGKMFYSALINDYNDFIRKNLHE